MPHVNIPNGISIVLKIPEDFSLFLLVGILSLWYASEGEKVIH